MKVKVVSNYNSDINMFKITKDIWGKYTNNEIVYDNSYDVLIIFNKYNPGLIKPNTKVFGFVQEPSWSSFYDKGLPKYCDYVFYHNPSIFQDTNVIFSPSVMLHHLWNKPQRGEVQWKENNTQNIINSDFEKTRKLSIIISNREGEEQYILRQNLIKKMLDSDIDFDMYGLGWNLTDTRYKGYILNKVDGLFKYKYSICMENTRENGYITEKFNDAILCGTIPLYYGASDVDDHYPNSSEFLDILSDNIILGLKNIINSDKDYNLEESRLKYLVNYNPFNIINDYV